MLEILLLCRSRSLRLGMSVKLSHGKEVMKLPSRRSSLSRPRPRKLSAWRPDRELKDIQRNSRFLREIKASLEIWVMSVFSIRSFETSEGKLVGMELSSGSLHSTLLEEEK